jgi:hypothetical protein
MTSLVEIWNLPIDIIYQEINKDDKDDKDDIEEIAAFLKYSKTLELSSFETEIINDPDFENQIKNLDSIPWNQKLLYAIFLYIQNKSKNNLETLMNENDALKKQVNYQTRIINNYMDKIKNPRCPLGKINEEGELVDPITDELIDPDNSLVLYDRCYNKNTLRQIVERNPNNPVDPFTRNPIPFKIIRQLFEGGIYFQEIVDYDSQGITNDMLQDLYFPENTQIVNLNGNQLTSLYRIQLPDSVSEIYLDRNHFSFLSRFFLPQHLNVLSFSYNQINHPFGNEFPLYLLDLFLDGNNIANLGNFRFPETLQILSLNNNQIENLQNFPEGLQELYVVNNRIQNLENLPKNLEVLNIGLNYLTDFNITMTHLKVLNIQGNHLTSLSFIVNLPEIEELNVSDNLIDELRDCQNLQIPNLLKILNLANNPIQNFEEDIILLIYGLDKLFLSRDQIIDETYIPPNLLIIEYSRE